MIPQLCIEGVFFPSEEIYVYDTGVKDKNLSYRQSQFYGFNGFIWVLDFPYLDKEITLCTGTKSCTGTIKSDINNVHYISCSM